MDHPFRPLVNDRTGFSARPGPDGIAMHSGTWQGVDWRHTITINRLDDRERTCLLIVTGGTPNASDEEEARLLAALCGLPVATLYDIPNQPIWDLTEDDLIAHTFDRFLDTKDPTWPVLMPMVRAVLRAMDAVQMATDNQIERFVVSGASKRGWTTWLSAVMGDARIVGIAPLVFDFLDIPAQLARQNELYGQPSEELRSYTERELEDEADSDSGLELVGLVDPFVHRASIRVPTLAIIGSNDRFWATDASSIYWDQLENPRSLLVMPGEGHTFIDKRPFHHALAAFSRELADGRVWPPAPTGERESWFASGPRSDLRDAAWTTNEPKIGHVAWFEREFGQTQLGRLAMDSPIRLRRIG